jgi:hypothetical protein
MLIYCYKTVLVFWFIASFALSEMTRRKCVVCAQAATQLRLMPSDDLLRREWLLRLNLLDEEMDELDERCVFLQRAGKKALLCYRHFPVDQFRDAMPIDVSIYRLIYTRLFS